MFAKKFDERVLTFNLHFCHRH